MRSIVFISQSNPAPQPADIPANLPVTEVAPLRDTAEAMERVHARHAAEPTVHEMFGEDFEMEPRVFHGLRAALMLNLALGALGLLGYELWELVYHWR